MSILGKITGIFKSSATNTSSILPGNIQDKLTDTVNNATNNMSSVGDLAQNASDKLSGAADTAMNMADKASDAAYQGASSLADKLPTDLDQQAIDKLHDLNPLNSQPTNDSNPPISSPTQPPSQNV